MAFGALRAIVPRRRASSQHDAASPRAEQATQPSASRSRWQWRSARVEPQSPVADVEQEGMEARNLNTGEDGGVKLRTVSMASIEGTVASMTTASGTSGDGDSPHSKSEGHDRVAATESTSEGAVSPRKSSYRFPWSRRSTPKASRSTPGRQARWSSEGGAPRPEDDSDRWTNVQQLQQSSLDAMTRSRSCGSASSLGDGEIDDEHARTPSSSGGLARRVASSFGRRSSPEGETLPASRNDAWRRYNIHYFGHPSDEDLVARLMLPANHG